jgi:hypothetical protein
MAIKKITKSITKEQFGNESYIKGLKNDFKKEIEGYGGKDIKIKFKKLKTSTTDITNPIADAGPKDACRINTNPRQFYLRFGYLLSFIKNNIIPKIKDNTNDNPSMFDIDTDEWGAYMYSLPNQISLDPRICIVRNSNFYVNNPKKNTQVFQELQYFREVDNGEPNANPNSAYTLNIYLNFEFILECLKTDDKGNVNVFEFLSSICTGLNKALGGINNLEPVIDETSNTLQIIDTTPIPGRSSSGVGEYTLQIYGYNKNGQNYISNFVRNVDLKTAITPEFATMVTVGATAGGYVKGTEATAFSKWNVGLTDRFKEELLPANPNSEQNGVEENEAEVNYVEQFILKGYVTRYGLTSLSGNFKLNQDAIERNLSIVTEYYKYLLAKEAKDQSTAGGTIGFIPFKLNLTLDGLSGIKIYNKLRVNTEFLPKTYGKTADLIVTGVSHNLSNNDWTTQIETTLIPKSGKKSNSVILPNVIQESIQEVKAIASSKSLKEVLSNAGYKAGTFVYELALAIGTKEGYVKNSKNRPSRNNNPGNLVGSNYKDLDPGVVLEPANSKGERRFAKFSTPELGAKALVERKIKPWARGNYPGTIVNGSSSKSNSYRIQWNVPTSLKGISGRNVNLTLEQFFYIYAPPSENNTVGYINSVVATLKQRYPEVTKNTKIIDYINR